MNDVSTNRKYGDPLSDEELAQFKAIEAMADDEIDYSDAPPVTDWSGAVRGKYAGQQDVSVGPLRRIALPEPVAEIYRAVETLEKKYGRRFPPDGHLVGSIGEVVAAEALGLTLHEMSHPGHDAVDRQGREVQIKMTGGKSVAMYATSERLVVLRVVTPEWAEIIYDGRGRPAWEAA